MKRFQVPAVCILSVLACLLFTGCPHDEPFYVPPPLERDQGYWHWERGEGLYLGLTQNCTVKAVFSGTTSKRVVIEKYRSTSNYDFLKESTKCDAFDYTITPQMAGERFRIRILTDPKAVCKNQVPSNGSPIVGERLYPDPYSLTYQPPYNLTLTFGPVGDDVQITIMAKDDLIIR